MKEYSYCDHCGAKMIEYAHCFNSGLAIGLSRLAKAGGKAHLKSLGLTINQFNNFQKIQHWGLVIKSGDDSGVWEITEEGKKFLNGKKIPYKAITYRNTLRGFSPEKVDIFELRKKYQRRKDYLGQKEGADDA